MSNAIKCPDCRGSGTLYDQVEWSDGLGGVTTTCSLCDGNGTLDAIADLRKYKRMALKSGAALAQLQRQVLCYVDTSNPSRCGDVRGMPGASPHVATWRRYLERDADATAERLTAEVIAMEAQAHRDGFHASPPPAHKCPLTNSRAYCPECKADELRAMARSI